MPLRASERETVIRSADSEDYWDFYSEPPGMQRVLRRLAEHGVVCERVGAYGVRCRVPKKWLHIEPRGGPV